jgi:hypothetical protein
VLVDRLLASGTETIFLIFLSAFTAFGAANIGKALRELLLEPGREGFDAWRVLSGVIFLVASLSIGGKIAGSIGLRFMGVGFVALQLMLALVVVAGTFFLQEVFAPIFSHPDVLIGAVFLLVGVGVVGVMIRQGIPPRSMTVGALFAGIGAVVLGRALWKMAQGELPE